MIPVVPSRSLKCSVVCAILLLTRSPAFAQFSAPRAVPAPRATVESETRAAFERLRDLGFWTGATYAVGENANKQAVLAFQKLNGIPRSGTLTKKTVLELEKRITPYRIHDSLHRFHLEVDLDHQVLFVATESDEVLRILSISSGNEKSFDYPGKGIRTAHTPRGRFKITYRVAGWHKSPLGNLYYPLYFTGGVAIHGAQSVPAIAASHGCVRVPLFAAVALFNMAPIGTPVIVRGSAPRLLSHTR